MAERLPEVDRKSIRASLLLAVGPAVFLLHFTTVYAANAVACARGLGVGNVPSFVLIATALASAVLLAVALGQRRVVAHRAGHDHSDRTEYDPGARRAFVGHLAIRIALLALLGIWLVALPSLFAQPCG